MTERTTNDPSLRSADVQAYYDDVYFQPGRFYTRPLGDYSTKLSWLKPKPGERLLDCSCGAGGAVLVAQNLGLGVCGTDLSRQGLQRARQSGARGLVCAIAEHLPLASACVDVLTCLGSLEHYLDPAAALREMRRVMRPAARALILVPNYYYWRNVLHAAIYGDHRTGHHQILERVDTYVGWRRLIESNGLEVTSVHRDTGASDPVLVRPFWLVPRRLLRRLAERLTPLYLTYQFGFVCRRAD